MRRRLLVAARLACLLMCLAVAPAGCESGQPNAGSGSTPVTSPTPTVFGGLAAHTILLPSFQANFAAPGPYGAAVYGSPGAQGVPSGLAGGATLYYYDFATGTIQTVVTAPKAADGSPGVTRVAVAGDWLVYGDGTGDVRGGTSEIAALDVRSQHRVVIASDQDGYPGSFATDGSDVAWIRYTPPSDVSSGHLSLMLYHLATGQSQVAIADLLGNGQPSAVYALFSVVAYYHGAAVIVCFDADPATLQGLYLATAPTGALTRLSGDTPPNASINGQYVVWDNSSLDMLSLYNRTNGQLTPQWISSCVRPALETEGPYLACIDDHHDSVDLVDMTTLQRGRLGTVDLEAHGAIAGRRAYWVAVQRYTHFSSALAYVDLPA